MKRPTAPRSTEPSLDGAADVLLAPVRGPDTRRGLPKEYFERHPWRFAGKLVTAFGVITAACAAVLVLDSVPLDAVMVVLLGLMYAYLVELQHECLHEHAFRARWANRLWGFVCGLFMFSSYSHYKYEHLRHHAYLGTPRNQEFFNYRFHDLDSPLGFARAAFTLGRYVDVVRNIARSCLGRDIPRIERSKAMRAIQTEYRLMLACVLAAVVVTVLTGDAFFVVAWLLPVLLVSEATHFLIELPEHFGLNTQTDPNVLTNTRTIGNASRFAQWFTNYNNLHTAHHYHQGVPMVNVPRLHEDVKDKITVIEPTYWSFYRKVLSGELRYVDTSETCMTR